MADNMYSDAWFPPVINTPAVFKKIAEYEQFVAEHGEEAALLFIEKPKGTFVSPGVYVREVDFTFHPTDGIVEDETP